MSDWQVGDLALCVNKKLVYCDDAAHDGQNCKDMHSPLVVASVWYDDCGCVVLSFNGAKPALASRFRKIRPSAIEHIEALKRLPVEVKEDA